MKLAIGLVVDIVRRGNVIYVVQGELVKLLEFA